MAQEKEKAVCYHVWFFREGANTADRFRKCFRTAQAANKAALIGVQKEEGPKAELKQRFVMKCPPQCECAKQRTRPCPNAPKKD